MRTLLALLLALTPLLLRAQDYPPEIPAADRAVVYKTIDDVNLQLWLFEPENPEPGRPSPAIVFFFGGGWRSGSPTQFRRHCEHLAARGMLCALADYRVLNRQGTKANKAVEDAKAAVRYLRAHAGELGIDPDRIAAGGGSAGGHLAAATALLPGHDDPAGDPAVNSVPNALALFNPAVLLAPIADPPDENLDERLANLAERLGAPPESMSPYHHIAAGAPPTVVFHGKADATVPYWTVERFCQKVEQSGGRCDLHGYDAMGHGFFNYGRNDNEPYEDTLAKLDAFFASLGWLEKSF